MANNVFISASTSNNNHWCSNICYYLLQAMLVVFSGIDLFNYAQVNDKLTMLI